MKCSVPNNLWKRCKVSKWMLCYKLPNEKLGKFNFCLWHSLNKFFISDPFSVSLRNFSRCFYV